MEKYGYKIKIKNKKDIQETIKLFREDKSKILSWTNKDIFLKYSKTTFSKL